MNERAAIDEHLYEAEEALAGWDLTRARCSYLSLWESFRDAEGAYGLALCAEAAGDEAEAERWYLEARVIDPEGFPLPTRIQPEVLQALISDCLSELPSRFRDPILESVPIVVEGMPPERLRKGDDAVHPETLGLYEGPPLEDSHSDVPQLPPRISLFVKNIERRCQSAEELRQEIRITLFHEIGHAFGFDEEGVEAMGLG